MGSYTEERPEAIEAIKQSIAEKWEPICNGCLTGKSEPDCKLCELYDYDHCADCPLCKTDNGCKNSNSTWWGWADCKEDGFIIESSPEDSEAMLEALVMLLPPEHRKEYGG